MIRILNMIVVLSLVSQVAFADAYCECIVTRDQWTTVAAKVKALAETKPTYQNRRNVEEAKKKLPYYQDNVAAMTDYIKSTPAKVCKIKYDAWKQADCLSAMHHKHADEHQVSSN